MSDFKILPCGILLLFFNGGVIVIMTVAVWNKAIPMSPTPLAGMGDGATFLDNYLNIE